MGERDLGHLVRGGLEQVVDELRSIGATFERYDGPLLSADEKGIHERVTEGSPGSRIPTSPVSSSIFRCLRSRASPPEAARGHTDGRRAGGEPLDDARADRVRERREDRPTGS
jgi:hypothetical protein